MPVARVVSLTALRAVRMGPVGRGDGWLEHRPVGTRGQGETNASYDDMHGSRGHDHCRVGSPLGRQSLLRRLARRGCQWSRCLDQFWMGMCRGGRGKSLRRQVRPMPLDPFWVVPDPRPVSALGPEVCECLGLSAAGMRFEVQAMTPGRTPLGVGAAAATGTPPGDAVVRRILLRRCRGLLVPISTMYGPGSECLWTTSGTCPDCVRRSLDDVWDMSGRRFE